MLIGTKNNSLPKLCQYNKISSNRTSKLNKIVLIHLFSEETPILKLKYLPYHHKSIHNNQQYHNKCDNQCNTSRQQQHFFHKVGTNVISHKSLSGHTQRHNAQVTKILE